MKLLSMRNLHMGTNLYVISRSTAKGSDGTDAMTLRSSSSGSAPDVVGADGSPEQSLVEVARLVCARQGHRYESFSPIQRLFITHYRCHACGLIPLFNIDYTHTKRAKCKKCNNLITFRPTGTFGRR
jgi:hypothetical protein